MATSETIVQDQPPSPQPLPSGGDLQPVTIFLIENNKLSPRAPKDKENPQTASCPNGFVRTGLFGFGFAPVGVQEWRDVGDWESEALTTNLNLGTDGQFIMYVTDTAYDPMQFNVTLFVGENPIGTGMIDADVDGGMVTIVTVPIKIQGSTILSSGDTLKIHIRARYDGSDDGSICSILYGNRDNPTGLKISSDAIKLLEVHGCSDDITVYYSDAFRVPSSLLQTSAKVDGIAVSEKPEYKVEEGRNIIQWGTNIEPGNRAIEVSIGYGADNSSWTLSQTLKIEGPAEKGVLETLADLMWYIIGIVIGVVVAVIIYIVLKRRRAEEYEILEVEEAEEIEEYPYRTPTESPY